MNDTRDSKIDAALSGAVLLGFVLILAGNALSHRDPVWRKVIVIGMEIGILGAGALSGRVFWRHRIGLSAWLLMFGVHAMGMALATQAFNWMRKGDSAQGARDFGVNALLLTVVLLVALLVRGAVLQAAAKKMPGWLAVRRESEDPTPRLWLFALYWISPIAWWAGILCALNIFTTNDSGAWSVVALLLCVIIATVRMAVRFVLFEKNRYTNWRRNPQGWEKFRAALHSAGFVLAGAVTFYTYFFMAARVQDDAFSNVARKSAAAWLAEIKAMQPTALLPKDNAESIYSLARKSVIPVNWAWAEKNWNTTTARNEVAKNQAALNLLRQGAAVKGIDFGFDWVDGAQRSWPAAWVSSSRELARFAILEGRQAAAKGDWRTAVDNLRASLCFARHQSHLPLLGANMALDNETEAALAFAAALFQPQANPSDAALLEVLGVLREHFDERGDFANHEFYFTMLVRAHNDAELHREERGWPGKSDAYSMLTKLAFLDWTREMRLETELDLAKLTTLRRMDRTDADELSRHLVDPGTLPFENLNALEALRLLEAAVGIKRYQLQHGAWPNTLAECVPQCLPAIPGDPNMRDHYIQYEATPPRVFSIGKALGYIPEEHGFPDENYFQGYTLKIKECEGGNRVLFLAN